MKNVERFGSLTSRMNDFREQVLEEKPYIDAQRALLATEAYKENKNQSAVMKRALMLKNILEKMSIYIEDETLIVGNQASSNKDAPIFPEYTMEFVIEHVKKLGARSVKTCVLLDKPSRRKVDLKPDYCCFEIEDLFVVGYGLNYGDHYRNIPYIFNWEK